MGNSLWVPEELDITERLSLFMIFSLFFSMIFSLFHKVVLYGCESWTIKKAECVKIVLEKTLESPLHCEEIKPVNPK